MISKKYIKKLELRTMQEMYQYIVESYIVGATGQCEELMKKMSPGQCMEFIDWFESNEMIPDQTEPRLIEFWKLRLRED